MALETSPDGGTVARRHLASGPFRPRGIPMPPGRVPGPVHPASPPQRAERAARNRGETGAGAPRPQWSASAAAPVPLLLSLVTSPLWNCEASFAHLGPLSLCCRSSGRCVWNQPRGTSRPRAARLGCPCDRPIKPDAPTVTCSRGCHFFNVANGPFVMTTVLWSLSLPPGSSRGRARPPSAGRLQMGFMPSPQEPRFGQGCGCPVPGCLGPSGEGGRNSPGMAPPRLPLEVQRPSWLLSPCSSSGPHPCPCLPKQPGPLPKPVTPMVISLSGCQGPGIGRS